PKGLGADDASSGRFVQLLSPRHAGNADVHGRRCRSRSSTRRECRDGDAGRSASVSFRENGQIRELQARLIVGADGRASRVRGWANFTVTRDPDRLTIAGALVEAEHIPEDGVHSVGGPTGRVLIAPQGKNRARMYFMWPTTSASRHLSGGSH